MMRRGYRYKKDALDHLINCYKDIVTKGFQGDYLQAVKCFESISETQIRRDLNQFYKNLRSADQAWKTYKGVLYEYAVFEAIKQVIDNSRLRNLLQVVRGHEVDAYRDQIVIRNWNDILPDVDLLIVDKNNQLVKAIASCKTSLRERLTETAFWKRELEKHVNTKNIKIIFITIDKDYELRNESNRYIILHVIDYVIITDPTRYESLIKLYREKYGGRRDFNLLIRKIKQVDDMETLLSEL
ncbi:MAG: BsaWI family type II restriction enzyme [Candidatus Korarchaeota archaeon]|nr:BsaWI family type II restriction enzyme [Thermoproteota archaeon]